MPNNHFNKLKIKPIIIAIDGPAASGKTTLGLSIARELNFAFLDSGKIYRLLIWYYQSKNLDFNNYTTLQLKKDFLFFKQNLQFKKDEFYFEGNLIPNDQIFNLTISSLVPYFVNNKWIRNQVTSLCQNWIKEKCFVLVGRDATTVIAPDAEVKFFINAAFDARVKRRWLNFKKKENSFKTLINKLNVSKPNYPFKNDPFYQKIKTEMKKRDENDRNRKIGSLKIALDAFEINNTFLDFTQTLKLMLQLIEQQNFTLPKVTIIGQSNVGKSTLFNRLAGKNTVLISQIANTTRDFYSKRITVKNRNFILVDTGGLTETSNFLEKEIAERTEAVINQSDWLFWVVDFNQPLNLIDLRINKLIKYHKNKTVLIINKAEKFTNKDQIKNFNQLGIKTQIPLSTKTKLNFSELLNWIEKNISGQEKEEESEKTNQILLFGKTNVGKSSLFNALCRKKRVIVSNQRHTTTNVVEEKILYQNHHLSFIDSAGIRKKRTKAQTIEKKAKIQILKYLKWIDLVLFVCDASQELTVQDKKMIDLILQFDKKFIIVGNKSDLIKENKNKIEQSIKAFFPFIKKQNISIFLVSSLKSYGVFTNLLEKILQILELK